MDYKSKTLQTIFAKRTQAQQQGGYTAAEFAKLKIEVERLKRKVEELTGERGDNPAVREKSFGGLFSRALTSVGGLFGA